MRARRRRACERPCRRPCRSPCRSAGGDSSCCGQTPDSNWTREQAIEYARQNSSESDTQIISEVERFIAIPGQALSYKIGELRIRKLRTRAEEALGARFDIKAFHRAVLADGALPLSVLEAKIDCGARSR